MKGSGKSDELIVPEKPPNNDGQPRPQSSGAPYLGATADSSGATEGDPHAERTSGQPRAEGVEERSSPKGNPSKLHSDQARNWAPLTPALERIRQVAERDSEVQFTTLWHHVYDVHRLRAAFNSLKRKAAAGVDGVTWEGYGSDLESNLHDLSGRLKRGAYQARPVKRVYIPKSDGRQRPIGIPALEDKVVQRATVEVLNAVYEVDFQGFSYGFRPSRSAHDALDAVTVAIQQRKVNWVLDADIRGFFDAIDHGQLLRLIERRIADKRVLRHIKKWLTAGVLDAKTWQQASTGTPQGGSISPLLANIFLHYALDLWVHEWRQEQNGHVIVVRYADDFVVGFQYREEAERFLTLLRARMQEFGLELHPDKTRLIEFGRFAAQNRKARGERKPETFAFLGFTHISGKTKAGRFVVKRTTIRERLTAKLKAIKAELKRRMHLPIREIGRWLGAVLRGHYNYYAVPFNYASLKAIRDGVTRLWLKLLRRRSQRHTMTWERYSPIIERWLPKPQITHPHPSQRLRVNTQGRSPVR